MNNIPHHLLRQEYQAEIDFLSAKLNLPTDVLDDIRTRAFVESQKLQETMQLALCVAVLQGMDTVRSEAEQDA